MACFTAMAYVAVSHYERLPSPQVSPDSRQSSLLPPPPWSNTTLEDPVKMMLQASSIPTVAEPALLDCEVDDAITAAMQRQQQQPPTTQEQSVDLAVAIYAQSEESLLADLADHSITAQSPSLLDLAVAAITPQPPSALPATFTTFLAPTVTSVVGWEPQEFPLMLAAPPPPPSTEISISVISLPVWSEKLNLRDVTIDEESGILLGGEIGFMCDVAEGCGPISEYSDSDFGEPAEYHFTSMDEDECAAVGQYGCHVTIVPFGKWELTTCQALPFSSFLLQDDLEDPVAEWQPPLDSWLDSYLREARDAYDAVVWYGVIYIVSEMYFWFFVGFGLKYGKGLLQNPRPHQPPHRHPRASDLQLVICRPINQQPHDEQQEEPDEEERQVVQKRLFRPPSSHILSQRGFKLKKLPAAIDHVDTKSDQKRKPLLPPPTTNQQIAVAISEEVKVDCVHPEKVLSDIEFTAPDVFDGIDLDVFDMLKSQQPTSSSPPNSEEPPVSSEEPPVSSEEPTVSSEEPPVLSEEPPVSSEELTFSEFCFLDEVCGANSAKQLKDEPTASPFDIDFDRGVLGQTDGRPKPPKPAPHQQPQSAVPLPQGDQQPQPKSEETGFSDVCLLDILDDMAKQQRPQNDTTPLIIVDLMDSLPPQTPKPKLQPKLQCAKKSVLSRPGISSPSLPANRPTKPQPRKSTKPQPRKSTKPPPSKPTKSQRHKPTKPQNRNQAKLQPQVRSAAPPREETQFKQPSKQAIYAMRMAGRPSFKLTPIKDPNRDGKAKPRERTRPARPTQQYFRVPSRQSSAGDRSGESSSSPKQPRQLQQPRQPHPSRSGEQQQSRSVDSVPRGGRRQQRQSPSDHVGSFPSGGSNQQGLQQNDQDYLTPNRYRQRHDGVKKDATGGWKQVGPKDYGLPQQEQSYRNRGGDYQQGYRYEQNRSNRGDDYQEVYSRRNGSDQQNRSNHGDDYQQDYHYPQTYRRQGRR